MTTARRKAKIQPSGFFKHLFLIVVSLISVFPVYWIVVSATNLSTDVVQARMLPGANLAANFTNLAASGVLRVAFFNSLRNSTVITLGALLISSAAGYGFVVYRDRGKDIAMKLLLLSMMVPTAATLIPLFRLFSQLKLINTLAGVMMPALATAFLIFLFRQASETFPQELIQAARIDGVGEAGIFLRIYAPVMKPTYAAAATVTFMNAWNSYLWPLVILQKESERTMPIFISNLMDGYVLDYGQIMLAVTITTLPTVIIFFLLQKSFVAGILGAVK